MQPMVNKALKGAAVGAGIGMCLWLGKQILPSRAPSRFDDLNDDANASLAQDANVQNLCERMKKYQTADRPSYTLLLLRWAELIHLQAQLQRKEIPPRVSIPRSVSMKCGDIVESIRKLRAITAKRVRNTGPVMSDFDEVAADFQRACNDYTFNIVKIVEYQQSG